MARSTAARLLGPALIATAIGTALAAFSHAPSTKALHHGLRRITFGHSVRGTSLRAVRLGDFHASRKALVVGVIHGDEPAGLKVLRALRRSHGDVKGVQLWVVKTVNPDGLAANTRQNARGVDLNR